MGSFINRESTLILGEVHDGYYGPCPFKTAEGEDLCRERERTSRYVRRCEYQDMCAFTVREDAECEGRWSKVKAAASPHRGLPSPGGNNDFVDVLESLFGASG